MIGYDPQKRDGLKNINQKAINQENVSAGVGSSCVTRFLCHPLDVLKIRFQLQVEPIKRGSANSKYRSIFQTFSVIIREESLKGLWKGHISGQVLSGLYGMVYFPSFELYTKCSWNLLCQDERILSENSAKKSLPIINFICGSLSGFSATVVSHPFDVVRTRLISQCENPKTYYSTNHAFRTIIHYEGIIGLYRGFLPTIAQIMPFSGAQFASYNIFKNIWRKYLCDDQLVVIIYPNTNLHLNIQASFVCGAASGTVAKLLVYPLDLVKKRLQIRGFEQARGTSFGHVPKYEGFVHCIVHTFQNENISAFYKGLAPSLVKATLTTAFNFYLYETMLVVLLKRKADREHSKW